MRAYVTSEVLLSGVDRLLASAAWTALCTGCAMAVAPVDPPDAQTTDVVAADVIAWAVNRRLAASVYAGCFVRDNGQLSCWGRIGGEILLAAWDDPHETDAVAVMPVSDGACIRDRGGRFSCWGTSPLYAPTGFMTLGGITEIPGVRWQEITGNFDVACGLDANGRVLCAGLNQQGSVGDGTTTDRSDPTSASGLDHVVQLVGKGPCMVALRDNGEVLRWGPLLSGEDLRPTSVPLARDVVSVDAVGCSACAVHVDGQLDCWSEDPQYFLSPIGHVPTRINGVVDAIQVSMGPRHLCVLERWGQVLCWGDNSEGQLGVETPEESSVPLDVPGVSNALEISVGFDFTCAYLRDGAVWCWGQNYFGTLGDGMGRLPRSQPGPVMGI